MNVFRQLKVLLLAAGLSLLLGVSAWAAPNDDSLLTNPLNRHNMSNWATHGGVKAAMVDGTDQICIFCHTPHAAEPVAAPLWNRTQPIGPAGGFPLYGGNLAIKDQLPGSSGIQAASQYGVGEYPNGSSRLCMSCHDGVTAVGVGLLRNGSDIVMTGTNLDADGSLQGFIGGTGGNTPIASVIDLATAHPISFIYNNSIAASIDGVYSTMNPPGPYYQGPGSFDPAVNSPLDSQSRMQCTTCHDPHYDTSLIAGKSGLPPFWQNPSSTNPYEDLCAQCHIGGTPTGPGGDHNPGPGI